MNIKKGKIGNALESVAPDHVVATATSIYDEALGKYQSELNQEIGHGGGGSGTVTGAKIGSGSVINPDGNGIIKLPNYTENATPHIAPTENEVKSALGTSSGTTRYLREDGTWQNPNLEQEDININLQHEIDMSRIRIDGEQNERISNDTLIRNELNAKQLEVGAVQTNQEPIKDSPNHLTSGVVASSSGYYVNSPEWVRVYVDAAKRILFGIRSDGSVDWGKGVPAPIKKEISKYHVIINSPEFVYLICDAKKHIVFGITIHGEIVGCTNKKEDKNDGAVPDNIWKGKTIVWYGTSIPAGSYDSIRFNGSKITYLPSYGYGDTMSEADGNSVPNQYPVMTGSLLGAAIVYNESLGSCSAAAHTIDTSLELLCKGMGNTVAQICGWLTDCYTIDWNNKTYQRNPNNSVGVTQFLADGNWNQLMGSFYKCIRISYQVALVARYLIKGETEHQAYIESAFGSYYTTFRNGLASAGFGLNEMCRYRGDVDLFVFDHGFNDPNTVGDTMTSFEGAMTEFFSLIYRYKPYVRVVMVTDYVTLHNNKIIVERQRNLAEKWNIPLADMTKVLPVSNKVKVRTKGYWNNGIWNNEGFTFSSSGSSYTTNNSFTNMLAGMGKADTLENVMSVFEPEQINGDWYWNAYPLCLWMQDALHPHSDKNGRLAILYARYLTGFLSDIGHCYNQ